MANRAIKAIAGQMGKPAPRVQPDQLVVMDREVQWDLLATRETTEIRDRTAHQEPKAVTAAMEHKASLAIRAFLTKPRSKFLFCARFAS